jgi:hypothetical protein
MASERTAVSTISVRDDQLRNFRTTLSGISTSDLRRTEDLQRSSIAEKNLARNLVTESLQDGKGVSMLIILIILLLVFGFGGYRLGPGIGYYGGGGISLILLIVIILLLLRVI